MISTLSGEKRKLVRALQRRKGRAERRLYLSEGVRIIDDITLYPKQIRFVYGDPERLSGIAREVADKIPLYSVDDDDLFLTENSQRIGAVVEKGQQVEVAELLENRGPVLLLDRLADPGNLGTILRSADWFGVRNVGLMRGSVDPWNPKSVRASMGALMRLNPAVDLRIEALESARPIFALDADGELQLGRDRLPGDGIYVIGSEAHGVDSALAECCSGRVSIPGVRGGESLNAAMAATLLCYELHRSELPSLTRS